MPPKPSFCSGDLQEDPSIITDGSGQQRQCYFILCRYPVPSKVTIPAQPANLWALSSASRPHLHLHRNLWWNKADRLAAKGLANPLVLPITAAFPPPVPFPLLHTELPILPRNALRQPLPASAFPITQPSDSSVSDYSVCCAGTASAPASTCILAQRYPSLRAIGRLNWFRTDYLFGGPGVSNLTLLGG